jgi:hypothetical protein
MGEVVVKIPESLISRFAGPSGYERRIHAAAQATIEEIGKMAHQNWVRLAQTELRSSQVDYIRGLQGPNSYVVGDGFVDITLRGWLANAVEQGIQSYDMKAWFLHGPKVKYDKKGRPFIDIVFRHGTPGTSNVFFPEMPQAIYDKGKHLYPTLTAPPEMGKSLKTIRWGGRVSGKLADSIQPAVTMPRRDMLVQQRHELPKRVAMDYKHAVSLYADMFKNSKKHSAKGQSSAYFTIRRISLNSFDEAWIHPGIRAKQFAPRIVDMARGWVDDIFKRKLRRVGIGRAV